MPGIELKDFVRKGPLLRGQQEDLIRVVHDVIEEFTGKRSSHSDFWHRKAKKKRDISCFVSANGTVNAEGFHYILVVDGEKNKKTKKFKPHIRQSIKKKAAKVLHVKPEKVAVRYRLHNASFG
jgi:hypothetical protein